MRPHRPASLLFALGLLLGVVSPAPAKERWSRVDSPYFTLYAECSLSDAKHWAARFDQFRSFVSEVIHVPPTQLQPLTIVLFNSRNALADYLPRKEGKVPGNLNSQTMTLPTGTVVITCLNWDDSVTRHSFYEAGTYWFLNGFKFHGPDWFQAGLAQTFKTFMVTGKDIRVGESPKENLYFLQRHALMPLPQLFGIEMKNLDFNGDDRTSMFFAQSWALVHYHIFGRDAAHQGGTRSPQLGSFMEALQKGEEAERAFQRVFGTDYDGMLRRLDAYISKGNYSIVVTKFDPNAAAATFAAEAENEAGLEMIHGYAELGGGRLSEARQHFLRAGTMSGGELRAEEALGDTAIAAGDPAEAQVHYGRAVELGSHNYRPYYYLGFLLIRPGITMTESDQLPRYGSGLARIAASRFERAINLYPRYIPSYEGLARLMPSLEVYSESDRQFLELGVQVAPDNDLIAAGLAVWEIKNQQQQKGRDRLRGLLAEGREPNPEAQRLAREMLGAESAHLHTEEARKLMADGNPGEAAALVEKLLAEATDAAERASLIALQGEIGQLDLVLQAEKLAADKQWEAAGIMARNALDSGLPPALAARVEAVLAKAQAGK